MARVPYLSREQLTASAQAAYDRIARAHGGRARNLAAALLNSPILNDCLAALEGTSPQTTVDEVPRETAILAACRELNCQYLWTVHEPMARRAGVRELVIEGIKHRSSKGMIPKEGVFVDYARQVLRHRVNDPTFAAIEHLLGRQGAVDLAITIGCYALLSHVIAALGVELDEGLEPLLPDA